MSKRIAINTGPLIALGKMQALDVIAQLPYEFICPAQVEAEIIDGVALGYPVALPAWVNLASGSPPSQPTMIALLTMVHCLLVRCFADPSIILSLRYGVRRCGWIR